MSDLLRLADAECEQVARAGAKAARLAQALRAGLPVPPGFVVPAEDSAPVLAAAAVRVAREGVHAARFAVMESRSDAEARWRSAARCLGQDLVVRSSSPWEDDALFAGALTSVLGVRPEEVPTAVRSVWASALGEDVAARLEARGGATGPVSVAALVQPHLRPELAGTARREPDGTVTIVFVPGPAAALMAGWEPGRTVRVGAGGRLDDGPGPGDPGLAATAVADLARAVHERWGDDLVEWAQCDGRPSLLQSRRAAVAVAPGPPPAPVQAPNAMAAARLAWRFAGPLGERCVLPWAMAVPELELGPTGTSGPPTEPAALTRRLVRLADLLGSQAWRRSGDDARAAAEQAWRGVRGPDPAAGLRQLAALAVPDGEAVEEFLRVARALVAAVAGMPAGPAALWACDVEELVGTGPAALSAGRAAAALARARRRWEPFVHAAVSAAGERRHGTPAAPGTAAGTLLVADARTTARDVVGRPVLVADRPWPRLASLLYGAAGLVTAGGSPAAHLVEVATSLGVPSVVGCDLAGLLVPGALLAVDGDRGTVAVQAR